MNQRLRPILGLILGLFLAIDVAAQVDASYLIPDIGTPGFNTYIEIIAPHDANGTFGSDGFYLNNPGDPIRVVPTGSGSSDIVVGPVVVSWSGRLISTQVFVKPGASLGQRTLRVTNGASSDDLDFYVVSPSGPYTLSTGGSFGGSIGSRSRRGAMIVSGLTLTGNSTYTINATNDTDPSHPGIESLLPFILISTGPVTIDPGVTIDGSASGRDGGPGGGGGGGFFRDVFSGGGGSDGGRGYVGGGAGGTNNFISGGGTFNNVGTGTGPSGSSFNGIPSGSNLTCYEGAGGGTGHPFGASGIGWCGGGSPSGNYGAGSTGGQDNGGGGGAFAANASSGAGSDASNNYGRAVGNVQLVPFAGGSGGASGNPQALNGGSGEGGGGGGAIAIYSMQSLRARGPIHAIGGDSQNGNGKSAGGSGSGGGVVLGGKISAQNGGAGSVAIAAGNAPSNGGDGSVGRFRHDGFVANVPGATPGATTYVGPSTDTLTYSSESPFSFTGTRAVGATIQIYRRGDASNWVSLGEPTYNGRNWSLPVSDAENGLNYFVATQTVPNPSATNYRNEPVAVMSQVAANIVTVDSVPRIDSIIVGGGTVGLGNVGPCFENPTLAFKFRSIGTETLNVRAEIINESTPGVFEVFSPAGIDQPAGLDYSPDPSDTVEVYVTNNIVPGGHTGILRIITNDPRSGYDTIDIPLNVQQGRADISVSRDTIDFGKQCELQSALDTAVIHYKGNEYQVSYNIGSIASPETSNFYLVHPTTDPPRFNNTLSEPDFEDTAHVILRFRPQAVGVFLDSIVIQHECGKHVVYLVGEGVQYSIQPPVVPTIRSTVGTPKQQTIQIVNTGQSPITLDDPSFQPPLPEFTLVDPSPLKGETIAPGDTLIITVEFKADSADFYSTRLKLNVEGPCNDIPSFPINAEASLVCLEAKPPSLSYIADSCSVDPDPIDSTITLRNCGGFNIELLETFSSQGILTDDLAVPHTLEIGNEIRRTTTFRVIWDPEDGTGFDTVNVVWEDTETGEIDTIRIPVELKFDRAVVELRTIRGDTIPTELDLGGVYQCSPAVDTLVLVNAGTIQGEITGRFAQGGLFTVDPQPSYQLAVGEERQIEVRLDPSRAPATGTTYRDTLILENGRCEQEWRVALKATRYQLEVDVSGIAFGPTNLGLPKTQSLTITNTTQAPASEEMVIGSVYIDPPSASPPFALPTPPALPVTLLANGGFENIDVSFTPSAEQVYSGRVCFRIVEPCDTVICVDVTGEGIESNIYVPQGDLAFGQVNYCEEDTLPVMIYSVGPEPLTVQDVRIVGGDAAGFEVVSISETLPHLMAPAIPDIQDSIRVLVRFIPGNVPPDGPKSSTLEIESDDPKQGLISVPLTGERVSPQVAGPALVDFGTVVVGQAATRQVTLTNRSNDTITIASPTIGSPFRLVTPTPLVIPPRASINVDVEFTPTDRQGYNDTLVGLFSFPCNGEMRVPITGEGLRGETVVSIPLDVVGEPGEQIAIPIVLEEARALADVGATTFRAIVRFNATMILPNDIAVSGSLGKQNASGKVVASIIDGRDRVIEIEVTNDPLPQAPDTLGWIGATVLLGDALQTPLSFDSFEWVDGEVASDWTDGVFTLEGYCDVGNDRLVRVDGLFGIKQVTPNPFSSRTDIIFETVEHGHTTVDVFDVQGRRVARLLESTDLDTRAHSVTWNAERFSAGVYHVVLSTPTQRSVERIVIVE